LLPPAVRMRSGSGLDCAVIGFDAAV